MLAGVCCSMTIVITATGFLNIVSLFLNLLHKFVFSIAGNVENDTKLNFQLAKRNFRNSRKSKFQRAGRKRCWTG
jgi:predicted ferric reductase